jgi:hypothetical protein
LVRDGAAEIEGMTRARNLRLLRIAASVVCLSICAAMVAMWVRSYYSPPVRLELPIINRPPYVVGLGIVSWKGVAMLSYAPPRLRLDIHYLLLVLLFGTLAGLPWVQWSRRFSLRAFLVVTGFVAVVLGLVVAMR